MSYDVRPQRTSLWPRRKRFVAEGDRGPFHRIEMAKTTSRELETRPKIAANSSADEAGERYELGVQCYTNRSYEASHKADSTPEITNF
jgi:hypothetical protein